MNDGSARLDAIYFKLRHELQTLSGRVASGGGSAIKFQQDIDRLETIARRLIEAARSIPGDEDDELISIRELMNEHDLRGGTGYQQISRALKRKNVPIIIPDSGPNPAKYNARLARDVVSKIAPSGNGIPTR